MAYSLKNHIFIIDSLLSMRLTLLKAIHYAIQDHKFIQIKYLYMKLLEKNIVIYVNYIRATN